ncbi:hypothetical protein ACO0LM_06490 [Undibacterium sp. Di26W]|uniref:hypothetical protein n=1 Tax=Undibacterium sp. Di26W TaxID=3413035 RepID=UPI003BF3B1D0
MSNALIGNTRPTRQGYYSSLKILGCWGLRIFLVLTAIVLLLLVTFIAINWKDETLTPEAQALLRTQEFHVPYAQNGFYILVMMNAALDTDLLKNGIDKIKVQQALYQKDKAYYESHPHPEAEENPLSFNWNNNRCRQTIQNCVQMDLANRTELTAQMASNQVLAERYALMRKMGDYEEHLIPAFNASLPAYSSLSRAIDLLLTQASFDIADGKLDAGLQRMESNNRYLRVALKNSSSLISKMVMQTALRKQARAVSELLVLYPALLEQYAERISQLVLPMTEAERSLERPFLYEAGVQTHFSQNLRASLAMTQDKSEIAAWPLNVLGDFTFQPNATTNMVVRNWTLIIDAARNTTVDFSTSKDNFKKMREALNTSSISFYLAHAYNPVGKILMQVGIPDYALTYIGKSLDTDAYLRLVSLQADILRKKMPDADIPAYLAHAPAALRSPYDGSAMLWDARSAQLKFIGHEKASSNLGAGNVNIVALR